MSIENTNDTGATEGCAAAAGYAAARPKPPLGPEPEWIWREKRMWHLIERLAGYANQTEHSLQEAWLTELRTRIDEVLRHTDSGLPTCATRNSTGET